MKIEVTKALKICPALLVVCVFFGSLPDAVLAAGPDLQIAEMEDQIQENSSMLTIPARIVNTGTAAGATHIEYHLISGDEVNILEDENLGQYLVDAVQANGAKEIDHSVAMSKELDPARTYWLEAVADCNDEVAEGDEANNRKKIKIRSDLTISAIDGSTTADPITGVVGAVSVNLTVKNNGSRADANIGYYLSEDDQISTDDIFLGANVASAIRKGVGQSFSALSFALPIGLDVTKAYWLGAIADYDGLIPERDETNNSLASAKPICMAFDAGSNTCTSMTNTPLVQSATTRHEGSNTLILKERSYDPDFLDPAKAAYWGTGHDGSAGRIVIDWGDGVVLSQPEDVSLPLTEMPVINEFRHTYSDEFMASIPIDPASGAQLVSINYTIWDNHPDSAPQTTQLTQDMAANHDPVIVKTGCYNIDEQTIVWRDVSRDEDYNDPAMSAKYPPYDDRPAGNDGRPGWLKVHRPNSANAFYERPLTDKETVYEFAHVYNLDAAEILAPDNVSSCDPALTTDDPDTVCHSWVSYGLADNNRDSYYNAQSKTPGGWSILPEHYSWRSCDYTNSATNDPNYLYYNKLPRMSWTISQGPVKADGSVDITLTDMSTDPDYNDPAKSAWWGGGNAGGSAIIRITWQTPGTHVPSANQVESYEVMLTDAATPHQFVHNFPAEMVAWGNSWLFYEIIDNHARLAGPGQKQKPWFVSSGWLKYVYSN